MSDASNVSPSPMPTTSGDETLTPTMRSGSSDDTTTSAYAPCSSRTVARTASASPASSRACSSIRCAMHSVSVSDTSACPSFSKRARSVWKFSMMPLWITAIRPRQS